MYGLSDHSNPIPLHAVERARHGSSRYSTFCASAHDTEHTFASVDEGVLARLTLPLPTGPRHVHCYFLRGDDGWTLVDTGLGLSETDVGRILPGVERIFITHMHPDHVGGAGRGGRRARRCTRGASTTRSASRSGARRLAGADGGVVRAQRRPAGVARTLIVEGHAVAPFIRFAWHPELVDEGDTVDGWHVLHLPGHADGHLALHRDGVLVAGDHLLARSRRRSASTRRAGPIRSATTWTRCSDDRAGAAHRSTGPREPIERPAAPAS